MQTPRKLVNVWRKNSDLSSRYAEIDAENWFDEAVIETYRALAYLASAVAEVGLVFGFIALRGRNGHRSTKRLLKWSFIPAVATQWYLWNKTSPDVADRRPRVHVMQQNEWQS